MKRLTAIAAALVGVACAAATPIGPTIGPGAFREEVLESGASGQRALVRLAADFYQRLEGRRFNSIATYRDPALREYFRSDEAFADYYADLAQGLVVAHFQASRPTRVEIEALEFDGPDRARARVRFSGENGLPLRWWKTHAEREDGWELSAGRWWIVPGKL